ncbi:MAG: hydrogenase nickel incorporation protein HypB [Alphaproteobacteria bacterium]|nr:hydrogenase nickel incorporation protein HypB [Alphaproteobacteria bacterium]
MCTICGCGNTNEDHGHHHDHGHGDNTGHLHFGAGEAGTSAPGLSQSRLIRLETDILGKNNAFADQNRARLSGNGVLALNLVSSPGSGKTTLLVETLKRLAGTVPVSVIEGDQQTSNDADRIRATGAPAVQINTGKGCHLDAHMVGHALDRLSMEEGGFVFIENVGNLVCPAGFDLGESARVVILSVTEGDDKPLKYPDIFAKSDLMILNKADLLPHVDFSVEAAISHARRVNRKIQVLQLSARTGDGLAGWLNWLDGLRTMQVAAKPSDLAAE